MTPQKTVPAGTAGAAESPGAARTPNAVARRGDRVVICLRHRDWKAGQPREYDDFWPGQVTCLTRAGLVRRYRPAGRFGWQTDGRDRPEQGQPLPSLWPGRAAIKSRKEIDVQGALATAACRVRPGHEDHVRSYATLTEVRAALRPHLPGQPDWERLGDAPRAWEDARREARPLLSAAVRAHGEEFRRLSGVDNAAAAAANDAYRQQHEQASRNGSAAA